MGQNLTHSSRRLPASARPRGKEAGIDAQPVGPQRLRRPKECPRWAVRASASCARQRREKLQDSHEIVGDEGADQFHADDQQEDAVHQFVERLRATPIHARQRDGSGRQRQRRRGECRTPKGVRALSPALSHTGLHVHSCGMYQLDKLSARFEWSPGRFHGFYRVWS